MGNIIVYRNGYIEVVKDFDYYTMRYYRNEKNFVLRHYKSSYEIALKEFKKVVDTEGF